MDESKYTDYGPESRAGQGASRRSGASPAQPTGRQLEFLDYELGLFIHFGLNTFTGQEHGDGKASPSRFNPTDLDCDQWARVAKAMGAQYVVFTARHEEGFCLWPTKTTEYCVRNSPWEGARGDAVRDFVDACRKHGLKPGLYHSSSFDAHHKSVLKMPPGQFLRMQLAQIEELLTNYGPIDYLWFDHHNGDEFWRQIDLAVARLQPNCLRFGPDTWIMGGHDGLAAEELWYAVDTADGTIHSRPTTLNGEPEGQFFRAWETNTTGNGKWFWHGGARAASLEHLMACYEKSVGRGANFLLNFAPDQRGRMPDDVVALAERLGEGIRRRFAVPLAQTAGEGEVVTLELGGPKAIDRVVVMEDLAAGQRVAAHCIEAAVNGQWRTVVEGKTVGHKRIWRFEPVAATAVRFRCVSAIQPPVKVRLLAAYAAGPSGSQQEIPP